jgi:hypothetical protein
MAKKTKNNGKRAIKKVSKIFRTKRNDKGNNKKERGKKKSAGLSKNVGRSKKGSGGARKKPIQPKAYLDSLNRSRSLKTGKYIKISKKERERLLLNKQRKEAREGKKRKSKKIKWQVSEFTQPAYGLKAVIQNGEFDTVKYKINSLISEETETESENTAIATTEQEIGLFWDVIERIREDSQLNSVIYEPLVVEKIDLTTKIRKAGVAIKRRILKIIFAIPPALTNVDGGVFYDNLKKI